MTHDTSPPPSDRTRDRGSILPIAMVLVVILGTVVVAISTYMATSFRSVRVTKDRTDRLAAAEAGLTVAIDRLQLRQTLCTTGAAQTDFQILVEDPINGATVRVTCRRTGSVLTDVQGWAAVVTGEGVSGAMLTTQGGGDKAIGGSIFVQDANRINISGGGGLTIVEGDLWYTGTGPNCDATITGQTFGIDFDPAEVRGTICVQVGWRQIFSSNPPALPPRNMAPAAQNPAFSDHVPGCRVFYPGTYTTQPDLAAQNYFMPGDYYFHNIGNWTINRKVLAGLPAGPEFGDERVISTATNCLDALLDAAITTGGERGATWVFGGNTRITIPSSGGELEIMRRPQGVGQGLVSLIAVTPDNVGTQPNYQVSTVPVTQDLVNSSSGNNTNLIIHGVMWAPYSKASLDNVTNQANGQLLGGIVVAHLHLQSSASGTGFVVEVDPSPQRGDVVLESVSTDAGGRTTAARAVVQFNPDSGDTAIMSWRIFPTGLP